MLEICAFVVVQFRAELIADSLQLFVDCCLYALQLIPPRGCAYVCFALRRDSARAVEKLKGGYKLNGSLLKVCH